MPAVLQRTFDRELADPKHGPSVCLRGARYLLGLNEDYILGLIADRALSFAWNVALRPLAARPRARQARREVRILVASIHHYIAHGSKPHDLAEPAAVKLLLPPGHEKPFLTTGELQRALNCVNDHILHLVEAGALQLQPNTTYRRGPNGSALVTLASFQTFLKHRRL
jgi:hypothetical protein